MRRFLSLYQFLVPLLLLPLCYGWWQGHFHNAAFVVFGLVIPIVSAYVIPGLGTNVLGLWEINTRFRVGKFRPQHGFVFGTGTALLGLPCLTAPVSASFDGATLLQAGFLMGTVLGFWNWVYDLAAIGSGFITVYNQPYSEGKGTEAIVSDYAPIYFGVFGGVYGMALYVGQVVLLGQGHWDWYGPLLVVSCLVSLVVPTLAFMGFSRWRHGHPGLQAFRRSQVLESVVEVASSAKLEAAVPQKAPTD